MNVHSETERRLKELRKQKIEHKRTYSFISPSINKEIEYYAEVLKSLNKVNKIKMKD